MRDLHQIRKMIKRILRKIKAKLIYGVDFNARGVAGKELDFLMSCVSKESIIMEIGCGYGQTTRRFADKGNKVYAIDPFLSEKDSKELMGENPEYLKKQFLKNIVGKNVKFYHMDSKSALEEYGGAELDLLFIDGEHTYKALETDVKWIDYVKEGGLIAFHDCNLPEINKYLVENIFPRYTFLGNVSNLFLFKKKKCSQTISKEKK